ncbi:MAG TPA: peptidyl-prolyl cis-trans isomerase [Verrucomicrobiae bacterium]|nr:peptidyl-prolyl cis-trans isomerase [Verrucomicrobiae bacterium]
MKTFLSFFVAGTLLLSAEAAHAQYTTGIEVVVNNAVITKGEVEARVGPSAENYYNRYRNDPKTYEQEVHKLTDQEIERMIEEKLILHDFISSGYLTNLLEAYVNDRINDYIVRNDYGDRAVLIRTLHAEGKTYEAFQREQRDEFIIGLMINMNSSSRKILISPLKVDQYYQSHKDEFKMDDQVKMRMIVLPQSPDSPPGTAKRLAEEILAKIDSGVPFSEMAQVYSAGAERAKGGDRDWVDRSDSGLRRELANVAFALKPGEHSGVIETPDACFLLKVDDVRLAHIKPLSEVRFDIERTLRTDENNRLKNLWIQRLRRKSFVSFY